MKTFSTFLVKNFSSASDCSDNFIFENVNKLVTEDLREYLLSVKGIGKETADDMLLYAFDREVFVVDTYTKRILLRHGIIEEKYQYEEVAEVFTESLEKNKDIYGHFHAFVVALGKRFCKKNEPLCKKCPLSFDI